MCQTRQDCSRASHPRTRSTPHCQGGITSPPTRTLHQLQGCQMHQGQAILKGHAAWKWCHRCQSLYGNITQSACCTWTGLYITVTFSSCQWIAIDKRMNLTEYIFLNIRLVMRRLEWFVKKESNRPTTGGNRNVSSRPATSHIETVDKRWDIEVLTNDSPGDKISKRRYAHRRM